MTEHCWWLSDDCLMTETTSWQLYNRCLITALSDDCLMSAWWLTDNSFTSADDYLTTAWQMYNQPDNCLTTARWHSDSWPLSYNCLTSAWRLSPDCPMTAWWLPDDYLMTAWWLPDDCLTALLQVRVKTITTTKLWHAATWKLVKFIKWLQDFDLICTEHSFEYKCFLIQWVSIRK